MILPILLILGCVRDEYVILLDDGQNFKLESTITAEGQVIAAGVDTTVDWSGLTTDLQGRAMDPATEITEVRVVRFNTLTEAEILESISSEDLQQADMNGFANYLPVAGETSALVSEFKYGSMSIDPPVDIASDAGSAFLTAALTGQFDYRMFTFFDPVDGAAKAPILIESDSAVLSYSVDLHTVDPVETKRAKKYIVDWSELTTNGYGNEIDLSNVDWLYVAGFSMEVAEVEADFLNIEDLAAVHYEAEFEGLGEYDLSLLQSDDGTTFTDFDDTYSWLIALRCRTCINPAPLFLGVLE